MDFTGPGNSLQATGGPFLSDDFLKICSPRLTIWDHSSALKTYSNFIKQHFSQLRNWKPPCFFGTSRCFSMFRRWIIHSSFWPPPKLSRIQRRASAGWQHAVATLSFFSWIVHPPQKKSKQKELEVWKICKHHWTIRSGNMLPRYRGPLYMGCLCG